MSIYGEGAYRNSDGERELARARGLEQLRANDWEMRDSKNRPLMAVPTPEDKPPVLASVYALSKFDQERMCLMIGQSYGIRAVALRLFNTYGPYQALSNPYTGVLSNFAARILNGQRPLIYEDSLQQRDFVSVYDVARAFRLALETETAAGAVNISSGAPMTVQDVAWRTIEAIGSRDLTPDITGRYRAGDIRHCFADISLAREMLGWESKMTLEDGLVNLAGWLDGQTPADRGMKAREELATRGLLA
jgi:dTDP-L-rhamnose 4-epimerase